MAATITVSGTLEDIIALVERVTGKSLSLSAGELTSFERNMMNNDDPIGAIKSVRQRLGLGLKEAKDLVDASPEGKARQARLYRKP